MIKKYGILGFSCLALLAIGCDDSSRSVSGVNIESSSSVTTVRSYSAEIDEQAKTITLTIPFCKQISETEVRFNPEEKEIWEYELSGDSLDLYVDHSSMKYTGNNSSLYGTWTSAERKCEVYGLCTKVEISSTSLTMTSDISGACIFDYMVVSLFSGLSDPGDNTIPSYSKINCNYGTIDIGGKTVNLDIAKYTENEIDMTLIVDGQKCKLNMNSKPLTASLCTIENLVYIYEGVVTETNMEEFMECYIPLVVDRFNNVTLEKAKKLKSMSKIFSVK